MHSQLSEIMFLHSKCLSSIRGSLSEILTAKRFRVGDSSKKPRIIREFNGPTSELVESQLHSSSAAVQIMCIECYRNSTLPLSSPRLILPQISASTIKRDFQDAGFLCMTSSTSIFMLHPALIGYLTLQILQTSSSASVRFFPPLTSRKINETDWNSSAALSLFSAHFRIVQNPSRIPETFIGKKLLA